MQGGAFMTSWKKDGGRRIESDGPSIASRRSAVSGCNTRCCLMTCMGFQQC